jgi:hypothetical protein
MRKDRVFFQKGLFEKSFMNSRIVSDAMTAKASYQSIYGLVESGWERTEKGYSLRICIPANTAATVVLPNGKKINLLPGEARFEEIC